MFSPLIVVVVVAAVALASSSKMAPAQCPCFPYYGDFRFIVCNDTSVTSIPDCVASDIQVLSIWTSSIPLVPDTIRRFTNLLSLNVEYFDNPQLSKNFLDGQKNISWFQIYQTSLDYVDNEWFWYAPRIEGLVLSYNKLASLASDTFSSLPLLDTVFLNNNQLTTLPPTLFEGTALKNLYIAGNPWHCDCELATFVEWTRDHGVTIGDQAYCLHPEELKGLNLNVLTLQIACK